MEGVTINEHDFEHINRLGKYSFKTEFEIENKGLKPLRKNTTN